MNFQEKFGFLLFVGKFILSKYGLLFLFLIMHLSAPSGAKPGGLRQARMKGAFGLNPSSPLQATVLSIKQVVEIPKMDLGGEAHYVSTVSPFHITAEPVTSISPRFFQKMKAYCIIATIVTLFLNPQQTKYFGGLAVVLKQAGFFTKYEKSEKMVYFFSWVFVLMFFYLSIDLSKCAQVE